MKKSSSQGFVILCGLCSFFFLLSCNRSGDKVKSTEYSFSGQNEFVCGPEILDKAWYDSGKKAPLFSGLEGIKFSITTKSAESQRYFNQGMMLTYGFNHAEAARSFYEAGRKDSSCAMSWWGFAYVLGPNYNAGMESVH